MDLDFEESVMYLRRAYVWGRFKQPKSKASKAPVPMHPLLAGFLLAWRERTRYAKDNDYVFPSVKLGGGNPPPMCFAVDCKPHSAMRLFRR